MLHRSRILLPLFCAAFLLPAARAETLRITSTPPGASVEIDGVIVGTTPFSKEFPGGYFHKTRTSLGTRLEHPMAARIVLEGYATKEIQLTDGPMEWISLNGRKQGEYWLFKSKSFDVKLEALAQSLTGDISATLSNGRAVSLRPKLSLEQIVLQTKPAVVYLRGSAKAGTGFLVTATGVIATNAHLARGEESFRTFLAGGRELPAKIVYIDPDFDIALLKIAGEGFPHLTLADTSLVRQGESVIAVGNPGDAMLFSVTQGVVSAVGSFPSAGPGTWIQTDAPINPGNSGGPLLNARGEVIGISTMKLVKKNVNGIGFALSAGDLLTVLRRFYPSAVAESPAAKPAGDLSDSATAPVPTDSPASATDTVSSQPPPQGTVQEPFAEVAEGVGTVSISSDPDGAEIYIDGKFFGNAPATLKLPSGSHAVTLKLPGRADWTRTLEILKGNKTTLDAKLLRTR
ncbi:MAG TPA: trypsin-like peptidase domain-containing protein [Candidatus Acidoferrum sp.]|nr:trypsin-like peptidase domain-containing protein [Candidatus Acidoferrum sp.]